MVPVIFFFQRQNTPVMRPLNVVKKVFFTGWSKTFRCKAREIPRNEAYFHGTSQ